MSSNPRAGAPPGADKRNGRPLATDTRPNDHPSTSTTNSVQAVEEIGRRVAADEAARDFWTQIGIRIGIELGRQQVLNEIAAEEERHAKHISALARLRSYDEMQAIRCPGYSPEELRKLREWCPA